MNSCTTAVILAAGRGKRMLQLTEVLPKPLVEVKGKNLIEWKLLALPKTITEIIFVVGYQGEQIRNYFGDTWEGRNIRYAEQKELNGTAGALWSAKDLLPGKFLVLMGDDLYDSRDIEKMLSYELAVCVHEVKQQEMKGEMSAHADGTFHEINEEIHYVEYALINTGLYMLDNRIFDYELQPIGGSSTEFGLPHTLALLARDAPVHMLKATSWIQISTPEDIQRAESEFVV